MGELIGYDEWKTREPDWPDERDPCPECGELGDDFFPCSVATCEAVVCPRCGPSCAEHESATRAREDGAK